MSEPTDLVERLDDLAKCPVLDLPVYEVKPFAKKASKEITSLRAKLVEAEGKNARALMERNEARAQFDSHVAWASDQAAKLESTISAQEAVIEAARRINKSGASVELSQAIAALDALAQQDVKR